MAQPKFLDARAATAKAATFGLIVPQRYHSTPARNPPHVDIPGLRLVPFTNAVFTIQDDSSNAFNEKEQHEHAKNTPVLISGLPGNMATLVTFALLKDPRYFVIPYTLVGPETKVKFVVIREPRGLIHSFTTIGARDRAKKLRELADQFPGLIIVDYSQPAAVNRNASCFASSAYRSSWEPLAATATCLFGP